MPKKNARKLVRNFYFLALLLNVIVPWTLAKIIIGDKTGEIGLLYVGVAVWSIVSIFLYAIYFAIPDFLKNWEKVASFLFPTVFCIPWLLYSSRVLILPLVINLIFNLGCIFYYKKKIMNVNTIL